MFDWAAVPVVDLSVWTGSWNTGPVTGEVDQVRGLVQRWGVDRLCLSPLAAAWYHNPHLANEAVFVASRRYPDVDPVPVIDPTLPTWPAEVERARNQARCRLVRLLPNYARYELTAADELLETLAAIGLGVVVQTRLEDPRHNHPLAQVSDLPAAAVAELAARHPRATVVLGGATWRAILDLREPLVTLPRFWAEVSQADGVGSIRMMVDQGLGEKLLFGTHAPFFSPAAGLARVLTDLTDVEAAAILGGNAHSLLAGLAGG